MVRDAVDFVAGLIYSLRIANVAQWTLRLLALGSLLGAAALAWAWFPTLLWQVLAFGVVVSGLWSLLQPDSFAPLAGVAAMALWWLAGAGNAAWWQTVVVALLLGVHHLATGYAAAAPTYSGISRRGARQMLAWGLGFLGASLLGMALVLGVAAVPADVLPRDALWVALALAGLTAAAVAATRPSR